MAAQEAAEDAVQALGASDPAKIGPFVLRGRLGQGGMGLVYLGTDSTGRDAAVKIIQPHLVSDPVFRDRFLREARLLARLDAACTARVLAADVDSDPAYLAVEYIDGPTLWDQVVQRGPLSPDLVRPVAVGLLEALASVHARGIIHRDLKPMNIILAQDGPKVIDFGIARLADATALTTAGQVFGSPGWMAPEQFSAGVATPATDVFAWGTTMAFACTGRAPYAADRLEAVYYNVLHAEPDLTGCPPYLLPVLHRALAKKPEARPGVADLLAQLVPAGTPAASPTAVTERILREGWQSPGTWAAASVVESQRTLELTRAEDEADAESAPETTTIPRVTRPLAAPTASPAKGLQPPRIPEPAPAGRRRSTLAISGALTLLAALLCVVVGVAAPELTFIYAAMLLTLAALVLLATAMFSRSGS